MGNICCFAGHRDIFTTDTLYNDLITEIEKLITEENVDTFFVGDYGKFDMLAKKAVISLKERFPHIKLCLILPYHKTIDKSITYDEIIIADMPLNTPHKYSIIKCNEYMMKKSDYLICYVYHSGGAMKTLEYAVKKNIKIINLYKMGM